MANDDLEHTHARATPKGERGRDSAGHLSSVGAVSRSLMNATRLTSHFSTAGRRCVACWPRARVVFAALALLCASTSLEAFAQTRRMSREFPVRNNVRLRLMNRSGTITVESWKRNEVKIVAVIESPSARVEPQENENGIVVDVEGANRGRADVGDVNFTIYVPANSMVDVETKRGNITVRGIEGALLRAYVTSEGDIELTGIRASTVVAENTVGNILFDAELQTGGMYQLTSMKGDISIRITANNGFRLMALANSVNLGPFERAGVFEYLGGRRKVVGKVGDGSAILSTSNQRGTISFMHR